MDSLDNFRERVEALEQRTEYFHQQTRTVERRLRWWRGLACGGCSLASSVCHYPRDSQRGTPG